MKKRITFILFACLIYAFTYSQGRKGQFRTEPGSDSHRLYVSIPEVPSTGDADITDAIISVVPELEKLAADYNIVLRKGIAIPEEKIEELERQAIAVSGSGASVAKLRNIFEVTIDNPVNERLLALAAELEKLPQVEYCSLVSAQPVKPPYDILPTTMLYVSSQAYKDANGVKMQYAWDMGLTGAGINIRDIEYGFNKDHEEFNDINAFLGPGVTVSGEVSVDFAEHGTAVFGIMFAHNGDYGVTGLAHGANEMLLFSEYPVTGYDRIGAIANCISASSTSDVVVYEMQMTGALGDYCPAEYDNVVWDITKAATDAGIIVVAAAGNGSQDLDAPEYLPYMERGDSGAIIVGAGTATDQHNRLDFSTYGERVDVHAWGHGVFTTGYGNSVSVGGDFNQGYTYFSGTSSATPIVASCIVVLQSYYHSLTGNYLTGQEMRELLKATGTPQGFGNWGNIGPIPNMETAIAAIQEMLGKQHNEIPELVVYPNPVQGKLNISGRELSESARAEVYNSLGQLLYSGQITSGIDLSSFAKGIYTVKITDAGKTAVKRVVKE